MHIIDTPEYRKAFVKYLRYGTPMDVSLKAMAEKRTASHYIWRTSGDEKVRASHAANNGKIFAWDNPPDTGHPGEDYNCRCWRSRITALLKDHSTVSVKKLSLFLSISGDCFQQWGVGRIAILQPIFMLAGAG